MNETELQKELKRLATFWEERAVWWAERAMEFPAMSYLEPHKKAMDNLVIAARYWKQYYS